MAVFLLVICILLFQRVKPTVSPIHVLWLAASVVLAFGCYISLYAGFRIGQLGNAEATFGCFCLIFKHLILGALISEEIHCICYIAIGICAVAPILLSQPHLIASSLLEVSDDKSNYSSSDNLYVLMTHPTIWELWADMKTPPKMCLIMFAASFLYVLYILVTRSKLREVQPTVTLFWISSCVFITSSVFTPMIDNNLKLPTDPQNIVLVVVHALSFAMSIVLYMTASAYVSSLIINLLMPTKLLILVVIQYSGVHSLLRPYGNWMEYSGLAMAYLGMKMLPAVLLVEKRRDSSSN